MPPNLYKHAGILTAPYLDVRAHTHTHTHSLTYTLTYTHTHTYTLVYIHTHTHFSLAPTQVCAPCFWRLQRSQQTEQPVSVCPCTRVSALQQPRTTAAGAVCGSASPWYVEPQLCSRAAGGCGKAGSRGVGVAASTGVCACMCVCV
jgi:hypothetical protein